MMLLQVFAVKLQIFPVAGYGEGFLGHLESLFLPALALALAISSILIRSLRNSILETMGADYVRTARAKGLSGRRVFLWHILRNSAMSTVTILAVNLAFLIGGTTIIETIFAIPGLGQLIVRAIFDRDYPIIQGATLAIGVLVLFINLVTDLSYAVLDPRVSYSMSAERRDRATARHAARGGGGRGTARQPWPRVACLNPLLIAGLRHRRADDHLRAGLPVGQPVLPDRAGFHPADVRRSELGPSAGHRQLRPRHPDPARLRRPHRPGHRLRRHVGDTDRRRRARAARPATSAAGSIRC